MRRWIVFAPQGLEKQIEQLRLKDIGAADSSFLCENIRLGYPIFKFARKREHLAGTRHPIPWHLHAFAKFCFYYREDRSEQSPIPQLSILLKLFFRDYLVLFRNYSSETILQKLFGGLQKLFRDLQKLFCDLQKCFCDLQKLAHNIVTKLHEGALGGWGLGGWVGY